MHYKTNHFLLRGLWRLRQFFEWRATPWDDTALPLVIESNAGNNAD